MPRLHRTQTGDTGSPDEVDEHGLGLIIGGMTGGRFGTEKRISDGTHAGLQVGAWFDACCVGSEGCPQFGGRPTNDLGLTGGMIPLTVVDVHRRHVTAGRHGQRQKRERVGPAGHANP